MDPKNARKALLNKFRQVCTERVNTILEHYTALVSNPDNAELIDRLMREVHTLKGELRIMGFGGGGKIIHTIEDVLKTLRDNGFTAAAEFRDSLTDGLDEVTGIVIEDREPDVEFICQQLASWEPGKAPRTSPSTRKTTPAASRTTPETPLYTVSDVVRVSGLKLDQLGDIAGDLFTSYLRLREMTSAVDEMLAKMHEIDTSVKNLAASHPDIPALQELSRKHLQDLGRSSSQFRREFQDRTTGMANTLDQVIDQVRELRLLPISTLFDTYMKAARDLARDRNKRVEVRVQGGSTMVDRSVLDALSDMLLHMIRNAVDHGIEDQQERKRTGKSEAGNLTLRARLVGDRVIIDVEDDGKGIDAERLKSVAIARGLLTPEEAATLDTRKTLELVFHPGLSTSEITSEVSGRGVGMDVVKNRIQDFGGAIHIRSKPEEGTCFSLELPTSVAITRVLLFRAANQTFAIMATFIDRISRLDPDELIESTGGQAVIVEDKTIPVVEATSLLQLASTPFQHTRLPLVVLSHGGKYLGLVVDELLGERELTIKPLGRFLEGVRGVSGAAMLEDGTVILMLHAGDLVAAAGAVHATAGPIPIEPEKRPARVLLVEDSLITRELERSMLSSLGLEVVEAGDGTEALEKLATGAFDLIVADVEMPRMNGYELTRMVKHDDRYAAIPVILVTTRGSPEDRKLGLQAGADAYVVKSEFKSRDFIETVQRFLP